MDNILELYKYFAGFVPVNVLEKSFVQPESSAFVGYQELIAELVETHSDNRISKFDRYVFSADSEFVSSALKDEMGLILFVEFGVADDSIDLVTSKTNLAITVAQTRSSNNSDNLNQVLISNTCRNTIETLMKIIHEDSDNNCFELEDHFELHPIDPKEFFGKIGWTTFINIKK